MTPTIQQARTLITTFGRIDPGPRCWEFIKATCPDLWRDHCRAILASDITKAASTFKAMIETWEQSKQPGDQQDLFKNNGGLPAWAI